MFILAVECVIACALFSIIMVGLTYLKPEAFFGEYAPAVQKRYLELNPDFKTKKKNGSIIPLIAAKVLMSLLFIALLTGMIYLAGAKTFTFGVLYTYIIWFVVNWYDVFVLDMGVFVYVKALRLKGTEDMDEAYRSNAKKHVKDGIFGTFLGIPISLICGSLLTTLV